MIDSKPPIIELVWSGKVAPHEVPEANEKIAEYIRSINGRPFDMLVDTSKLISFPPETQRLIVEQQKWVLSEGMRRSAVITPNAVVNTALDMTRKRSGHTEEFKFGNREEALAFLKE